MPTIEKSQNFELPPQTEEVLQKMFAGYQRVVIKEDFSALGYSGSWVIWVDPIKNTPELPVVVKLASRSLIEKEWRAYEEYVRNKWPGIAQLRGQPVFLQNNALAGLCYLLEGGGVFAVKSLREYCLEAEVDDIKFVLQERLFQIMRKRIVYPAIPKFDFSLRASYDNVLPVNLLVKPLPPELGGQPSQTPTLITPDKLPSEPLSPDVPVRLEGFIVTKVDLRYKTVTLNLPPNKGNGGNGYRWRLRVASQATYQVNQLMPPVGGVVIKSRQSRFEHELARIWPAFKPADEKICLPNGTVLPNPLNAIPTILNQLRDLKFNCIHGDLNLENVLVDPKVRDVRLIDFAEARYDHVLHDFLRLETEVVTKLIPIALGEAKLPLEHICSFYQQLHCATFHFADSGASQLFPEPLLKPFAILTEIRKAARDGFFSRDDFNEYYQGLTLYLVGTLRFKNLDSSAKKVAFWGAATIQQLMTLSPPCPQEAPPAQPREVGGRFQSFKQKSAEPLLVGAVLLLLVLITFGPSLLSWALSWIVVLLLLALITWRLLSPRIAVWYNNQGAIALHEAGHLQSAREYFRQAIYFKPDYPEAHYNLGLLYEEWLDFERAQEEYELAAKGGLDAAHNNLSRSYIRDGNYTAAVYWLKRGLELAQDEKVRYYMLKNLGWARLGQARYAEAESHLREAIRLNPDRAPAYCLLAQVREKQNQSEAHSAWEKCLKYADSRNPDEEVWIGMAREELKRQGDSS